MQRWAKLGKGEISDEDRDSWDSAGALRVCPDSVQVLGVSTSTLGIGLELLLLVVGVIEGISDSLPVGP